MTDVYRSGLRDGRAYGIGGHGGRLVDAPAGFDADPESYPETPGLFQCDSCYVILTFWQLREGFYPRPCRGRVRALPPAPLPVSSPQMRLL